MGVWRMKTELRSEDARKNLLKKQVPDPEAALKLLVATARIDGEISPEERTLLDTCAKNLGISDQDFARIYAEGHPHSRRPEAQTATKVKGSQN